MQGRLQACSALVTGAGQGIGAATARRLAAEGAHVFAADINPDTVRRVSEEIAGAGHRATPLDLDVTRESSWREAADALQSIPGGVDILVNNAGIELVKPFAELSLEEFQRVQAVNVDGVFLGCQVLLPLLQKASGNRRGGASVVNISSVAGLIAFANQLPYTVSKAGVAHLSKGLAVEFAESGIGIRVNSVHPGFIWTPMLAEVCERWAAKGILGDTAQAVEQAMADMQPTGRLGTPEDIAAGVAYLASEDAAFVTGSGLVIDGGWVAR